MAQRGVVDEALYGGCKFGEVARIDQEGVFLVLQIFHLTAVVGGDMGFAEHHIFQIAYAEGLAPGCRKYAEIGLHKQFLQIGLIAQHGDVVLKLIGFDKAAQALYEALVAVAYDGEVIGALVELCDGAQQHVHAFLLAHAAVKQDKGFIGVDFACSAQVVGLGIVEHGSYAVVNHRGAATVEALGVVDKFVIRYSRREYDVVDVAQYAAIPKTGLGLLHAVAGEHHAIVGVFRYVAGEHGGGGVLHVVHMQYVVAALYLACEAQRRVEVAQALEGQYRHRHFERAEVLYDFRTVLGHHFGVVFVAVVFDLCYEVVGILLRAAPLLVGEYVVYVQRWFHIG